MRRRRRRKRRSAINAGYDPGALPSLSRKAPSRIEPDLMLLHQVIKRGPADPEELCRFRQIGAGLRQSKSQHFAFGAGARGAEAQRLALLSLLRKTEIERREQRALSHYDRTLQTIFQLTDIAWPGVIINRGQRRRTKAPNRAAVFRRESPEKE